MYAKVLSWEASLVRELAGSGLSGADGRGTVMGDSGGGRPNLTGPPGSQWEICSFPPVHQVSGLRCGLWPQAYVDLNPVSVLCQLCGLWQVAEALCVSVSFLG